MRFARYLLLGTGYEGVGSDAVHISERVKTLLAFAGLSGATIAFEIALVVTLEPLPPVGPIAVAFDRGFAAARANGAHGAPGISVAIVREGRIAYTFTSGLADVASGTPVTEHTRFRAASVTKMLTAVTAMQLVEAGRLGLDDAVVRYLPNAPHARDVTIRDLLAHRSGLPNVTDMAFSTGLVAKPVTPEALLDPLVSQPLDFAPGSKYEYSNTNFVELGQVIEKIDGRPLAQIEAERIFGPAAMTESSFGNAPPDAPYATGYDDPNGAKPTAPYDASWLYAAGDLVTTASDLARFDIALMDGKLITRASFARLVAPLSDMGENGVEYGLGFTVFPLGTHALVGHHGGVPGFAADDEMIANAHFATIVLANDTDFYTSSVTNLALATLAPADFALAAGGAIRTATVARSEADPGVEAKLRSFLQAVSTGTLDRATLSPQMAQAMTSEEATALAKQLPPAETLRSLTFLSHTKRGDFDISTFAATYADSGATYRFVLDADGKVAGFFLR